MTIIAIGGEKGGVGKTCLATNLAARLAMGGARVALFDADEKPSALAWLGERPLDAPTIEGRLTRDRVPSRAALRKAFDHVVIDCGGGDTEVLRSALAECDLFLAPFRPAQFDVWKAEPVVKVLKTMRAVNRRLDAVAVLNAASGHVHRQDEAAEARSVLETFRPTWRVAETVVHDAKAFVTVQKMGVGVHEYGRRKAADAIDELDHLVADLKLNLEEGVTT